jgi:hypothetical protein
VTGRPCRWRGRTEGGSGTWRKKRRGKAGTDRPGQRARERGDEARLLAWASGLLGRGEWRERGLRGGKGEGAGSPGKEAGPRGRRGKESRPG